VDEAVETYSTRGGGRECIEKTLVAKPKGKKIFTGIIGG
jgi:hypothetical protein